MKYELGSILKDQYGFSGKVDAIFADYEAAVNSGIISDDWFEMQEKKPSSKDQVFYSVIGTDGLGAVLVGENDVAQ